ncbi:hypothetical protein [Prevotella koreensis]
MANKRLIRSPFIARSFPTGNAFKAKRRKNAKHSSLNTQRSTLRSAPTGDAFKAKRRKNAQPNYPTWLPGFTSS